MNCPPTVLPMSSAKVAWAKVAEHMMGKWKSMMGNREMGKVYCFCFLVLLRPPSALKVIVFLSLLRFLSLPPLRGCILCILCPRQFNYKLFHVRTVSLALTGHARRFHMSPWLWGCTEWAEEHRVLQVTSFPCQEIRHNLRKLKFELKS